MARVKRQSDSVGRGQYDFDAGAFRISEFQSLSDNLNSMADQIKLREQALIKEQNILSGIMASTDVMLVYLDTDFNFVAVNPAYASSCKKKPEELIGKNHFGLYPNADNEAIFKHVRDTGETAFFKDKPFFYSDQPERGATYWDWSLAPIKNNNEIVGLALALRETTKFKLDQEKLLLDARILESMSEGVTVSDNERTIIYTNSAQDAMFGYERGELNGQNVTIFNDFPSKENDRIVSGISDKILSKGMFKGTFRNRKKDGTVFYTYSNISCLHLDDKLFFVSVQRDITDEKKLKDSLLQSQEKLRMANELLEEKISRRTAELEIANLQLKSANEELDWRAAKLRALASDLTLVEHRVRKGVARILHDHLQQILAAANLHVQSLTECDYEELEKTSSEISMMIGEALQVSRTVTAQLSPPILFDSGLPAGLDWLCRWMEEKHQFKVKLDIEDPLPALPDDLIIFLFESARESLFNAVKHSRAYSATVGLRIINGHEINLNVSDEGQGFDPNGLSFSADSYDGFGLFSMTERIKVLGGNIKIDSKPGHGTRISISIPFFQRSDSISKVPRCNIETGVVGATLPMKDKIRIMVVDDHVVMREGLTQMLSKEPDIEIVAEAKDGVEAIALASKLQPDIILMDISMPAMDGIEATRIISQSLPGIKIIGLSMYPEQEQGSPMRSAGAVGYVCKGGSKKELLETIRACFKLCNLSESGR